MPSSKTVATGAAARVTTGAEKCSAGAWKAYAAEARDSICAQQKGAESQLFSISSCATAAKDGHVSRHAKLDAGSDGC